MTGAEGDQWRVSRGRPKREEPRTVVRGSSALLHQRNGPLTEDNCVETELPRSVTAEMQTRKIRDTRSAYSTSVAPLSRGCRSVSRSRRAASCKYSIGASFTRQPETPPTNAGEVPELN